MNPDQRSRLPETSALSSSKWVRIAAVLGFLGVALGAFGAHGLRSMLEANGRVDVWQTAVFYHLVHAVALLAVASSPLRPGMRLVGWSWLAGVLLFSGSLYLLAILNQPWLGAITPLGGVSFLVGWGCLVFGSSDGERRPR